MEWLALGGTPRSPRICRHPPPSPHFGQFILNTETGPRISSDAGSDPAASVRWKQRNYSRRQREVRPHAQGAVLPHHGECLHLSSAFSLFLPSCPRMSPLHCQSPLLCWLIPVSTQTHALVSSILKALLPSSMFSSSHLVSPSQQNFSRLVHTDHLYLIPHSLLSALPISN